VLVVSVVTVFGCTLGPNYRRPPVSIPQQWQNRHVDGASLANLRWWELFQDQVLQELVRSALTANSDVLVAAARVQESRALLTVVRSRQFPEVNVGGSADTIRQSKRSVMPLPPGVRAEEEVYTTALDLAFEVDLWGRLRRATEAARAELLATEEARQTVITGVVSTVAQGYFTLLELDRELAIARATLVSRQDSLRLVQLREREGVASELDRRQAEVELEATAVLIPQLERGVTQTENAIRVLLGENPGPVPRGASLELQVEVPAVPAGLPSELLERRPDIRQAEQALVAANARIGEARAAFFPRVTLTGFYGTESIALSDLFTGPARAWQFGPSVSIPLFNAGRIRAQFRGAEARHAQALVAYQQSVRQAFREVEDALVAHRKAREAAAEQARLIASASRALTLAQLRYDNGLSPYLDVLDVQRRLLSAELDAARFRRDQLVALVQVYRALGGGWTPDADSTAEARAAIRPGAGEE
jgi:multidrug efflux system outer membrane protein